MLTFRLLDPDTRQPLISGTEEDATEGACAIQYNPSTDRLRFYKAICKALQLSSSKPRGLALSRMYHADE